MKLTACLAWFDETPASLHRCVSSLAGVCDRLVAIDGRWALFPGETFISSDEERNAISEASREADIPGVVIAPGQPWASQVEKRRWMMTFARENTDWLLVIDGDEHIAHAAIDGLRAEIADAEADVLRVMLRNVGRGVTQGERPVRRLFRASSGVTVETAHNGYRAADGRWLHGDPAYAKPLEHAPSIERLLTIEHDVDARPQSRRDAAQRYRLERMHSQAERWAA